MLEELRNARVLIQGAELHEMYLLHMVHLIWLGQSEGKKRFEAAAKAVNPNLNGLGITSNILGNISIEFEFIFYFIGYKKYTKKNVVRNKGSVACSGLLDAYGVLFQYDAKFWANKGGGAVLDFEPFIVRLEKAFETTRPYLHLFAEPYVFFLVKNGQQEKAEEFILK